MPELSYGTHFFQDLVETGIFYLALFPDNQDVYINRDIWEEGATPLSTLLPEYKKYEHVIKILDFKHKAVRIVADIMSQKIMCYFGIVKSFMKTESKREIM